MLLTLRSRPARVDLSELPLGDAGVREVCGVLLGQPQLEHLRLRAVGAGEAGAESAAELVAISLRLRTLELSKNARIGDEGARRIARALRSSRRLERLEMAAVGLGDAGATAIADALAARRIAPLRSLDLSLNPRLGSDGVEALRVAAASCRHLQQLELAGAGAATPLLAAAQQALNDKRTPSGAELWAGGLHSAFTLRFAPPAPDVEPPGAEGEPPP